MPTMLSTKILRKVRLMQESPLNDLSLFPSCPWHSSISLHVCCHLVHQSHPPPLRRYLQQLLTAHPASWPLQPFHSRIQMAKCKAHHVTPGRVASKTALPCLLSPQLTFLPCYLHSSPVGFCQLPGCPAPAHLGAFIFVLTPSLCHPSPGEP